MEVIRIPQVSLVDASGKNIGVYTDNPDWWQRLKKKHEVHSYNRLLNETYANTTSPSDLGSNSQLISNEKNIKKASLITDSTSLNSTALFDEEIECNVVGETPLHIAIVYEDLASLKVLIENKGFDVNQRNVGGTFTSGFDSKLTSNLIQQSKYEGLAYYGEYPLAFAACFANKEIYDYLIEKGADPNLQGTVYI